MSDLGKMDIMSGNYSKNDLVTTKLTRKLDIIREDLNTQILEVINSAIAGRVLPSVQNVLGAQKLGLNTMRDNQSCRLDRSPEDYSSHMNHRS